MKFGINKCNTVIEIRSATHKPQLGTNDLDISKRYTYLGICTQHNDPNFTEHAKRTLLISKRKFGKLHHYLSFNFDPKPDTKIEQIYKKLIRPAMEYGQQILQYDEESVQEFERLQTDILRK